MPELSNERILQLAARPAGFGVTWRYRDEALMRRCNRLVRKGLLRRGRRLPGGGASTFHLNHEATQDGHAHP